MIKPSNDSKHMSYEEALKVYNEHAAANGFDLKEHGDFIPLSELLHVMNIEYMHNALDDLIAWG